jgi:hypothetical protein
MNLRRVLAAVLFLGSCVSSAGRAEEKAAPRRPEKLGVKATLVFLYYKDTARAQRFYEDVLGLELVVEQAFTNIYQISPTSFVGLVDEARGMHKASEKKAVTHRRDRRVVRLPREQRRRDAGTARRFDQPPHPRLRGL